MSADFLGICCADHIYIVDEYPQENIKIRAVKNYIQAGGFATNAAKTFALLGGEARLHTYIGINSFSNDVYKNLDLNNLKIIDYAPDNYNIGSSSIIINKTSGSRTIVSSAKDNLIDCFTKNLDILGNILFIDGFYIWTAISAIKQAKNKKIKVVFDADKWRDDRYIDFLSNVDYVIAGSEFYPPNCRTQSDVILFFKDMNIENFAITNGSKDIVFCHNNLLGTISVPQIECIDSLGAGDVFHGAFCYYIQNNNFEDSLKKSSQIASKFCTDYGFKKIIRIEQELDDTAVFGA